MATHDDIIEAIKGRLKDHAATKALVSDRVFGSVDTVQTPCIVVSKGKLHSKSNSTGPQLTQADVRVESTAEPALISTLLVAVQTALAGWVGGPVRQCVLLDTGKQEDTDTVVSRRDTFAVFFNA